MSKETRTNLLDMDYNSARQFFLKPESFFNVSLPRYFNFSEVINRADMMLSTDTLRALSREKSSLSKSENVNYKILASKDGNYAWRPFQILHPLVYVDLVNEITKKNNWEKIRSRFKEMQSDKMIECISIPVESNSNKSDTAEAILNWWENLEQAQLKYSLDFDYCIHTDISDCYSSIYTHSIPWALHGRTWAKSHRQPSQGIGNSIDTKIQYLQNGQTNGIPQGSVLMDFIAEIVLGYADLLLSQRLTELNYHDFKILRYRDDYRILSNSKDQVESIIKNLSDILSDLNLRLNSSKTFLASDVILDAIKQDKIYWDTQYAGLTSKVKSETYYKISVQKHLLQIKILGNKFPNCGSLNKALSEIYKNRIVLLNKKSNDTYQLISIVVDIMLENPRVIEYCIAILGRLFECIETREIEPIINKVINKFEKTPNTDFVEVWLQRLSLILTRDKEYNSNICKKVVDPNHRTLWNSEWVKEGFDEVGIIDEVYINNMSLTTSVSEVNLFATSYD